jgi:hypothetical protein
MSGAAPVLDYTRPLEPGSVRISQLGNRVSITIAPDTPKRLVFTLALPTAICAGCGLVALYAMVVTGSWIVAPVLVALFAIGAIYLRRAIRRSRDPIVFVADPTVLHVQNPLDEPVDRMIGAYEIAAVRVRPVELAIGSMYQLQVLTKDLPNRPSTVIVLLASPSFETLDKIARTIVEAIRLVAEAVAPSS